jgi:hypothetical protein
MDRDAGNETVRDASWSGDAARDAPDGGGDAAAPGSNCTSDLACAPGRCNPLTRTCQECLFHRDCANDGICKNGSCVASRFCLSSSDCQSLKLTVPRPAGLVCGLENRCVECGTGFMGTSTCPSGAPCVNGICQAPTACLSALMCGSGQVCSGGGCVECAANSPCGPGRVCGNNRCRPGCASEPDCAPYGMHCAFGVCLPCLRHSDCAAPSVCVAGDCRLNQCDPTAGSFCSYYASGSDVLACNEGGSITPTKTTCGQGETCTPGLSGPTCVPAACTPNSVSCQADVTGRYAARCSEDGTSFIERRYCGPEEICLGGGCVRCPEGLLAAACAADGSSVITCDSQGNPRVSAACSPGTVCGGGSLFGASCSTPSCAPGTKVCVGTGLYDCVEGADGGGPVLMPDRPCPEHCWDGQCVPISR